MSNAIKHQGTLPLCWMVRATKRPRAGVAHTTVSGPYTLTKARRVAIVAEWRGEVAELEEVEDATARHRAMINARRSA